MAGVVGWRENVGISALVVVKWVVGGEGGIVGEKFCPRSPKTPRALSPKRNPSKFLIP